MALDDLSDPTWQDPLSLPLPGFNESFTIGGTVFESATCASGVEGATVHLEDVNSGATLELTTNEMGNFYSDEALAGPFWISVEKDGATATMEDPGSGSCNSCHREGSTTGFVW